MNMAATMKMKVGGTTVGGKAVSRSVGEKILRKKGEGVIDSPDLHSAASLSHKYISNLL